jgi:hypothetical protein
MDAWVWIVIAVVLILLVGAIAWAVARERRTTRLREQFGPEYDRTVGLTEAAARPRASSPPAGSAGPRSTSARSRRPHENATRRRGVV